MDYISILLVLAAVPCLFCIELNQPPAMVVKPGETFTIACKITGYSASGGGYTNWIRHSSGKPMEWIGWFYTSSSNGVKDSLKNKISFSSESSSNAVILTGQNFNSEDTAVYYCARNMDWQGEYFDYWGKGTQVTVSSAQTSAPKSIFGLSQCSSDSEFLTIGCVTRGFFPADSLTFKWKDAADKQLTDFVQYPAFGSSGDYTKISHLRVKKSDWDLKKSYTCEASNSAGTVKSNIQDIRVKPVATVTPVRPDAPVTPVRPDAPVTPVRPDKPDEKTPNITIYRPDIIKDHVSLVCEVTSPKAGDVYMWKVGRNPYKEAKTSATINRGGSTSVLSILTVSKQEYEDPKTTITCAVRHANMKNTSAPLQVTTSQRDPPEPEKGLALNCNNDVLEEDEFRSLWSTATSFIFLFLFSLTYSAVLSLFKMKQ